jgi:tetratricopeptide (TPR) repeat protein
MPGRFANLEFQSPREEPRQPVVGSQAGASLAAELGARAKDAERWGRFEDALRLYTRVLREDRRQVAAWVGQVQMLVELDECREARVWADKSLELFQNHGDLLAAKAQAVVRLKDQDQALALSDAALAAEGDTPGRWRVRGEVLLARGQRFAGDCFEKAVAHPAADWFEQVVVARVYAYYGRMTNALLHIRAALQLEPAHGYTWLLQGQYQETLGQLAPARDSYAHALDLRPAWEPATQALEALDHGGHWGRRLRGWLRRWRT